MTYERTCDTCGEREKHSESWYGNLKERYNSQGRGVRCEYNIKIELGCDDVEWVHLARGRDKWRALMKKEFHKMRRIC